MARYETSSPIDHNDSDDEWEEQQEYLEMVRFARERLCDYYGTGAQFHPAMYTILGEIRHWSPERILQEARKIGLL